MTTRFFKPYLLGARHQIIVRSDHNNLKYFKSPKKVTPRQARWMNHLADYNFIIHHLPGKQNTIADLLSQRKDLERGMNNAYTTVLPDNLFLRTTYLPNDNQKRRQILQNIHDTPTGGHPGISNTFDLVKRKYHGPNSGNSLKTMSKDAPNAKKVKPFGHHTHPCITLIPLWKKDPSNMFQWTLSLIFPNPMDTTPSSLLWTKDAPKQLNSYHATKKSLEKELQSYISNTSSHGMEYPSA